MIGSVIVVILLLMAIWTLLGFFGLFNKIGKLAIRKTEKIKEKAMEEYENEKETI